MSIKYWISNGNSDKLETCKDEQELFEKLEEEFKPFREKIGDVVFVDERGSAFSISMAFMLSPHPMPEHIQMIDDDDIEIIEVACDNCLSIEVTELGICLDCGHVNPFSPRQRKPKLTSGHSH